QGLGGMPMTPPMSPGGAGGGGQGAERPDAAGLLKAGTEPWESEVADLGEPEAPQGALPGVAGPDPSASTVDGPDLPLPGIVSAVPGPPDWSPSVDDPAPGVGALPVLPPWAGNREPADERSKASELLESTDTPWEREGPDLGEPEVPQATETQEAADWPPAGVGATSPDQEPEPPEDWVPVVRRENDGVDTSAWEVPGGGLPWLAPFPVAGRTEESDRDRPGPDYTERDTRPWEPAGDANWRRTKWAEVQTAYDEVEEKPILCGGLNLTPEELAAMEEEEERARLEAERADADQEAEEKERTSADLLVRDTSAWGDKPAGPPSGVIG
ncbi:hypothetical protein ACFWY9_38550, partial [Amycolatopsis sp. NPDC059027]|uniref:hypothetical protein n=1 Tax=Amycolatopsis sp. NPDC059027 TaxID=3346709 RepID=UPI0036722084